MKIAYLADLHARGRDIRPFLLQLEAALEAADERGCEAVVVLGDTFDRSNIHDKHATTGRIVSGIVDLVLRFEHMEFYFLDGNHDRPTNESRSANWTLMGPPNLEVIDKPDVIEIGGVQHFMLPWVYGSKPEDVIVPGLGEVKESERAVLCAHLQVLGAQFAPGIVAKDGTFAIDKDVLAAMPFERFFLGDFHVRQEIAEGRGGYVGGFRELNFSEEGIETGFEVWDTESRELEYIPLDAAPRHLTLLWKAGEPAPEVPGGNCIPRIRPDGWVPAQSELEGLDGIRIDPIIESATAAARVESMSEGVHTSPQEALSMWLGCTDGFDPDDTDDLFDRLEEIRSDMPDHTVPRPVRFESTKIENFGPHDFLVVDWNDYGPLAGMIGPNGAGKTFVMEADFACLTGELPSYGGGIYEAVKQGEDGASISSTFWVGDTRYWMQREINAKGRKQEAFLRRCPALGEMELLAGPKVGDVKVAIEALIGPPRVALATWFSAQGGVGDICLMPRSEVRTVFSDMKNLAVYDELSQVARKRAQDATQRARKAADTIESMKGAGEELERAEEALREAHLANDDANLHRSNTATMLSRADEAVEEAEKAAKRAEDARLDRVKLQSLEQRESDLSSRLEAVERDEARVRDLRPKVDRLPALRDKMARHNAAVEGWKAWDAATDRVLEIEAELASVEVIEINPETLPNLETKRAQFDSALNDLRARESRLNTELSRLQGMIESTAAMANPEGTAGPDVCAPCSLYQMAVKASDTRRECEEKLEVVGAELQTLRDRIATGTTMLQEAQTQLQEARARADRARDNERRRSEISARLDAARARLVPYADKDILEYPQEVQDQIQDGVNAETIIQELGKSDRTVITAELESVRADIAAIRVPEAEDTEAGVTLEKARAHRKATQEALDKAVEACAQAASSVSIWQDREAAARKRFEQLEAARITLQSAERDAYLFEHLAAAFSKTGAPALILDHATRALEVSASRMLAEATGGAMTLVIATTGQTTDGRTVEDFSIRIRDRHGERDVSRISGGESRLVRIVLRRALMAWLSTSGGDIRVDEAFDALDEDRAGALIDALQTVSGSGQIVLVTHNTEHAARLPRIIDVSELTTTPLRRAA